MAAKLLSEDEARRIAANIAKLPGAIEPPSFQSQQTCAAARDEVLNSALAMRQRMWADASDADGGANEIPVRLCGLFAAIAGALPCHGGS